MTADNSADAPDIPLTKPPRKLRLRRLALKELRETLRDRRTIITLILMPLLVYPVLSLVFKTFLLSNASLFSTGEPVAFHIAYAGNGSQAEVQGMLGEIGNRLEYFDREQAAATEAAAEGKSEKPDEDGSAQTEEKPETPGDVLPAGLLAPSENQFVDFKAHDWVFVHTTAEVDLQQLVESGAADIGIMFDVKDREKFEIGKVEMLTRGDQISSVAANYLFEKFEQVNQSDLKYRLRSIRVSDRYALSISETSVGSETESPAPAAFPLASIVPLILVLMTITGAVYPAIDLTAGERERGTLETLMAAPIPRMGILWSKFVAVLTVAVMTAVLNLIGMFATVWVFQLDKQFGGGVFSLSVMFQVLLLLILFAAFFSALLLVVTSFAKSFKEAQVYLIPIILLSLGPGLMAMAPGMTLDGVNSVVPMVNILLLARDVIQGQVMMVPAIVAVLSTLFYAYLALRLAARIFGSDSILFAESGSFAEMFQRPAGPNYVVPVMATIFCLVMLFPINFASIGYLGRMPGETALDLQVRYLTMGVFTFLAFMVLPWLVAKHQSTLIQPGFGLNIPRPIFILAGVLLGISMWPLVMSLTAGWHDVYGFLFGSEQQDEWHKKLVETTSGQVDRIRQVAPWVIAIAFSIVPAVCEEWFFRGMLQRSLLKTNAVWKAILMSALIFGSFHVLSNSVIAIDRLIPSTLIGLMLGYLAYKSNSILPGIILHSLNNAIVIFLAYFQPQLSEMPWFPGEEESIPVSWVVAGVVVAALGASLVWFARREEAAVEIATTEAADLTEAVS